MRRLVIIGAGGHGREVLDVIEAINAVQPQFEVIGFLADDDRYRDELSRRDIRILGPVSQFDRHRAEYVVAIGDPEVRAAIDRRCASLGVGSPILIHPSATIGSDVHLGPGSVVMAGARITTNVISGRSLQVNVNATLSHDGRVGDYVTISPGCNVNGNVHLADGVYLGAGVVVIPGVKIGPNTIVGAGAVVTSDLPGGITAVGVPAKQLAHKLPSG